MIVAVAADHGGWSLKKTLIERLASAGHRVVEPGPRETDPSDDYPDFALAVGRAVAAGEAERGIVICGSGVGACVAANKIRGIRAGLCHDTFSAHQGVEDDDMNVLCLGARVVGPELAWELARVFLAARFSGLERHLRRLGKVAAIERGEA